MKRSLLPNIVASCVLSLSANWMFAQKDPGEDRDPVSGAALNKSNIDAITRRIDS
jgi:hypothetical protein